MLHWDWAWIEAKYRSGLSARKVADLCKHEFRDGPDHSTIHRRAKAEAWTQDKPAVEEKRSQLAASPQDITLAQFEEALKGLVVRARQKHDLDKAHAFVRGLFDQLEAYKAQVQGAFGNLELSELRAIAGITRNLTSAMKDLIGLEWIVHDLGKPEKSGQGAEATEELNKDAIVVAARFIDRGDGFGEEPLEAVVSAVHAVHVPDIPASAIPLQDGEGLGSVDADEDDQAADSLYTTETW